MAVDATGLAPAAVSSFFVRRVEEHSGVRRSRRHWLKWLVVVDVDRQLVVAQTAHRGPWNDCARLPALVASADQVVRVGLVLADAEFDSERNHRFVREQLGADSVIPARRGKASWTIHGIRAAMRTHFPRHRYRRRNLIETVFSVVKRKLSARAPGRMLETQARQALLLGLAYNVYRL